MMNSTHPEYDVECKECELDAGVTLSSTLSSASASAIAEASTTTQTHGHSSFSESAAIAQCQQYQTVTRDASFNSV